MNMTFRSPNRINEKKYIKKLNRRPKSVLPLFLYGQSLHIAFFHVDTMQRSEDS